MPRRLMIVALVHCWLPVLAHCYCEKENRSSSIGRSPAAEAESPPAEAESPPAESPPTSRGRGRSSSGRADVRRSPAPDGAVDAPHFGGAFRSRWVSVPHWVLLRSPGQPVGVLLQRCDRGLPTQARRDNPNRFWEVSLAVGYQNMSAPDGNWLGKTTTQPETRIGSSSRTTSVSGPSTFFHPTPVLQRRVWHPLWRRWGWPSSRARSFARSPMVVTRTSALAVR